MYILAATSCHAHCSAAVQVTGEDDWNTLLRMEEEYVENICAQIVAFKPDIVITEKGVSDLAQHYFMKVLNVNKWYLSSC